MIISGDVSTCHDRQGSGAAPSRLAAGARFLACLLLAALIAAVPAEAARKKKRVRAYYAPPQAAMVVDLHTGKVIFEENADKARFPASITKVMTLYMLFEQMKKGDFEPDTELKVSEWAASRPPSKLGLKPGQTIKVYDAMRALVTKSANDVASVVAENVAGSEEAFARMMTHKARMIGMTDTTFVNASGLPDPRQSTTARDLITLGRRVLEDYPEEAKLFQTKFFEYGERVYQNHNRMLFSYAGMEGMKTGYTRASGFNLLASCRRDNKRLMAVVLGGSSSKNRNGRMRVLLDRSWRTAIAMKDGPRGVPARQLAVAGAAPEAMMPERNPAFHEAVDVKVLPVAGGEKPAPRQDIDIEKELVTHAEAEAEDKVEDAEAEADEADEAEIKKVVVAIAAPKPAAVDAEEADAATGEGDVKPEAEPRAAASSQGPTIAPSPVALKQEQPALGPYHVQVGSFLDAVSARRKLQMVTEEAEELLKGHAELTVEGDVNGKAYFRARYGKFSRDDASSTCTKLKRLEVECLVVRVE